MRRALRTLSRADDATLTDYDTPLGLQPLRRLLARRMGEQGIEAAPEHIILMESGTQAIALLCRLLRQPGDTVLVDDPCYFNFHALLRAHRAEVISVPYTPSGPDVEAFARALSTYRPRLYSTNSALHNPTGAMLSPVVAHRVLKLAEQSDVTIIEDDIFRRLHEHADSTAGGLRWASSRRAYRQLFQVALGGRALRLYRGSAPLGRRAHRPKIATSFGSGRLSSQLVLTVLKAGGDRKHIESVRTRLARAMSDTVARLKPLGIRPWIDQPTGMFLWCSLPEGRDARGAAHKALASNVVLAPGNAFSLSHTANGFLRFNVSQSNDERMFTVLKMALRDRQVAGTRQREVSENVTS